jgi:hypothetical protein
MVEKNGCFQIIGRFFIEFAQADLDAHIQPSEVLYRHIEEIQKYMPEMVDYLRRVSREGLQQYKQTLRGIRKRGLDIRKRYVRLTLAYLMTLLYLSVKAEVLSEKAKELLKELGQV